jgi:hypothetical protein
MNGHALFALLSEKNSRYPTEQEAGWTSDLVCMPCRKDKYIFPARNVATVPYSSSA